jgi:hypothetical protein
MHELMSIALARGWLPVAAVSESIPSSTNQQF